MKRSKEQITEDIKTQMKTCCVCLVRKSFSDFYNFKNKSDNKCYRCKSCDDQARYAYKLKNPVSSKLSERNRGLKFKYGILQEDYEEMLTKQGGGCAICGSKSTKGRDSFSVDHCHKTGVVRGLLCNNCNRGLGLLGDNTEGLQAAITYLEGYAIH